MVAQFPITEELKSFYIDDRKAVCPHLNNTEARFQRRRTMKNFLLPSTPLVNINGKGSTTRYKNANSKTFVRLAIEQAEQLREWSVGQEGKNRPTKELEGSYPAKLEERNAQMRP